MAVDNGKGQLGNFAAAMNDIDCCISREIVRIPVTSIVLSNASIS